MDAVQPERIGRTFHRHSRTLVWNSGRCVNVPKKLIIKPWTYKIRAVYKICSVHNILFNSAHNSIPDSLLNFLVVPVPLKLVLNITVIHVHRKIIPHRGESKAVQRGKVTVSMWMDNKAVTVMSTPSHQQQVLYSVDRRMDHGLLYLVLKLWFCTIPT